MGFAARIALLCGLAPLMVGAAPARPQPLAAVFSHMRAAAGPLYNAHLISTSPHAVDGQQAMLDTDVQGLRFSLRQCTGAICVATYFDGERLYSVNINGTALPRSPAPEAYLRALRITGVLDFLSPDFQSQGGRVYDGGYTRFEGRRCREIFVSDTIATPMKIFVDPHTWLVAGAQDMTGSATYVMRDYRRVGPYRLPYTIDRNGAPLERYVTRAVASGNLEAPQGLKPTFSDASAGMPIDPGSSAPVGTCTIGGLHVKCLIDTGNSSMSMSLELAEKLNLKPIGMLHVAGLGDYATEVVRTGPLEIGNVRFGDANYIVLSDISRYGYDLVLGADILASAAVTIDYSKHALYFGRAATVPQRGATVPLQFQNFVPVVSVTLGDLPTMLAVDTGDESNINLAYAYYRRHSNLFSPTSSASVSGVGGASVEMLGHIPSVTIGNLTAQNQEIGTTQTLKGTADGHLGSRFLSNYTVVLDYARGELQLLPKTVQ